MRIVLWYLLITASINLACAQPNGWQNITIGDSVSVAFPGVPRKLEHKGIIPYGLYVDQTLYSVSISPGAAGAGITRAEQKRLYREVIRGASDRAKATAIDAEATVSNHGFEGMQVSFTPTISQLHNPVSMRCVLVNGTLYSLMFSSPVGATRAASCQRFFASFTPSARPAPSAPSDAYHLGELMGQLFVYGLVVAGALFLLLRKTTKPLVTR